MENMHMPIQSQHLPHQQIESDDEFQELVETEQKHIAAQATPQNLKPIISR